MEKTMTKTLEELAQWAEQYAGDPDALRSAAYYGSAEEHLTAIAVVLRRQHTLVLRARAVVGHLTRLRAAADIVDTLAEETAHDVH
jgi:hypothetical protein